MRHVIAGAGLVAILLSAVPAWAAEQTVTLAVDNLFCASCPYIVKRTLANVPGVIEVKVSYEEKTAVVTFEDSQTNVATLTEATGDIGFPSQLMPEGG